MTVVWCGMPQGGGGSASFEKEVPPLVAQANFLEMRGISCIPIVGARIEKLDQESVAGYLDHLQRSLYDCYVEIAERSEQSSFGIQFSIGDRVFSESDETVFKLDHSTPSLRGSGFVERIKSWGLSHPDRPVYFAAHVSPITYLRCGHSLVYVRFSQDGRRLISTVSWTEERGLDFTTRLPSNCNEVLQQLRAIYPCSFDAVLVSGASAARVFQVFSSDASVQQNVKKLLTHKQIAKDEVIGIPHWQLNRGSQGEYSKIVLQGDSQGRKVLHGTATFSLDLGLERARDGEQVILVSDAMAPSNAAALTEFAGVVLIGAGLSSHISIMAQSMGLAVICISKCSIEDPQDPRDWLRNLEGADVTLDETEALLALGHQGQAACSQSHELSDRVPPDIERRIVVAKSQANLQAQSASPLGVGLCRSEMQLYGHSSIEALKAFVEMSIHAKPAAIPADVMERLRSELKQHLVRQAGQLLNYRLVDASTFDLFARDGASESASKFAHQQGLRGPRWAFKSGFYAAQISMIASVVSEVAPQSKIDLIVTLPSAFGVGEVEMAKALYEASVEASSTESVRIRFGAMLECVRMCEMMPGAENLIDTISVGLNDLTQSAFGLERDAWPYVRDYYLAQELVVRDPYRSLDAVVVGPIIDRTLKKLNVGKGQVEAFICGAASSHSTTLGYFSDQPYVRFSVEEGLVDAARWSLWRSCLSAETPGSCLSDWEEFGATKLHRLSAARSAGLTKLARELALDWIEPLMSERSSENWKRCKKALGSILFGPLESRYFEPSDTAAIFEYASELQSSGNVPRLSIFPRDISCHSESFSLGRPISFEYIADVVARAPEGSDINVFPQQSADQLCFRLAMSNGLVTLEAGWGQAMYVFENERGQHETASVRLQPGDQAVVVPDTKDPRISNGLRVLIKCWPDWLTGVQSWLPFIIGTKVLAIEAYFDPKCPEQCPIVVDLDLPVDFVWN